MENKNLKWSGKSYGGYWGNLVFLRLLKVGLLPAYFLLVFVSAFFVVFRRRAVAPIAGYLSRIFGRKISAISWQSYKSAFSFGVSILDKTAYFAGSDSIGICDESAAVIERARARGRGVLILASHTGGWAIASGELARKFPDAEIVGANRERAEIAKLSEAVRTRGVPETLADTSDGFSPIAVYGALKRGAIAAMHADRDAGGRSVEADFLGGRVAAPSAPYVCAWRAGAAVLQIFCVRRSPCKYVSFCREIDLSSCANSAEAAQKGAGEFFGNLEEILKQYPYQWYNFYDFWK